MSTRVLIISEDHTDDQYIVRPVIERIFEDLGRSALVEVLQDRRLRGAERVLAAEAVAEVLRDNVMMDLFLLVVDRDCDRRGNTNRAMEREAECEGRLIACVAVEEIEVWMLALHRQETGSPSFQEIRAHCDPKEAYAEPFLARKGWATELGKGRKLALRRLGAEWKGLLQLCPEIDELKQRIASWLASQSAA